jgi:hypothetical protein
VAVFASILSVNLAMRRFYSEKWWERKAEAYSRIVEELYHVLNSLDTCLVYFDQREELPQEDQNEINRLSNQAYKELYKAECIGAFIISDDVANALSQMREKEKNLSLDDPMELRLRARSNIVSECLNTVKSLARKELKKR